MGSNYRSHFVRAGADAAIVNIVISQWHFCQNMFSIISRVFIKEQFLSPNLQSCILDAFEQIVPNYTAHLFLNWMPFFLEKVSAPMTAEFVRIRTRKVFNDRFMLQLLFVHLGTRTAFNICIHRKAIWIINIRAPKEYLAIPYFHWDIVTETLACTCVKFIFHNDLHSIHA